MMMKAEDRKKELGPFFCWASSSHLGLGTREHMTSCYMGE